VCRLLKLILLYPLFIASLYLSNAVLAADQDTVDALKEKLAEAQKQLDADLASKAETDAKRQEIEDKLAARKQREDEIKSEFEALCKEQDSISPGSFDSCLEKLLN